MHCKPLSIEYVMYVYGLCLFYLILRSLHLATSFYHLVAKWRLNNFFNFEPCVCQVFVSFCLQKVLSDRKDLLSSRSYTMIRPAKKPPAVQSKSSFIHKKDQRKVDVIKFLRQKVT